MEDEKLDDDNGIHEKKYQQDSRTSPVSLPVRDEIQSQEKKLKSRDDTEYIQEI
jgi:hypothetical protein